jgi:galactokinase
MDQVASACGVEGHALLLDCATLEIRPVPVPDDVDVVVVHSGVGRTLAGSAYAERRAACERAEAMVGPLRQATLDDVERIDDPVVRRRARHAVTEMARVRSFADALGRGDVAECGRLMVESHTSLRDDFEVSVPELDGLVARLVATAGVLGARLTGAGFGGCAVALARRGALNGTWTVRPAAGAHVHPQ